MARRDEYDPETIISDGQDLDGEYDIIMAASEAQSYVEADCRSQKRRRYAGNSMADDNQHREKYRENRMNEYVLKLKGKLSWVAMLGISVISRWTSYAMTGPVKKFS